MKVALISHTPQALELLLYTKNTRLKGECTLEDIINWPDSKKMEHLAYIWDTIQSSWEFLNYTFEISEVTRNFTHQFIRTRTGSYAQETQRAVDVSENSYSVPKIDREDLFKESIESSISTYQQLRAQGVLPQDARGVLPSNLHTSIIASFNLRTLSHMAELRLCTRTQGEYQDVFRLMREAILEIHPWTAPVLEVYCVRYGICAFPRYKECPFHHLTADLTEVKKKLQEKFWGQRHEAKPIAVNGRTM